MRMILYAKILYILNVAERVSARATIFSIPITYGSGNLMRLAYCVEHRARRPGDVAVRRNFFAAQEYARVVKRRGKKKREERGRGEIRGRKAMRSCIAWLKVNQPVATPP